MNPVAENQKSALLVVDMQKGVVAAAFRREDVIEKIGQLVQKARANHLPVIWVQHSDDHLKKNSDAWQLVNELTPEASELLISKNYGDSFEATPLESELKKRGIRKLYVCGAQTEACIRSTIHGAFVRGYSTTLIADAHTTEDMTSYGLPAPEALVRFTNLYWSWQAGPGRQAAVVPSTEVHFDGQGQNV